ncbi:MAG: hypothetical protein LBQ38_13440 [Spirochaetaceae bacterium]|jgi:hypothetical protein|nr:hypothetical protein [Spirochaetaceae bacterium]
MGDVFLPRLLPRIRRARDFRLYTEGGGRLVDLWQYGGRALLGHTPPGLFREIKNTAARGLAAPLPGFAEGRLLKALARIFPGRDFRLYADEASLRRALAAAAYPPELSFPDPALPPDRFPAGDAASRALSLWRPFLDDREAAPGIGLGVFPDVPVLVPVLPLPWPGGPQVLALEKAAARAFPPSDLLSPVILAAAARSLYDLIAAAPLRGAVPFPKIKKALSGLSWRRQGIYFSPPSPLTEGDHAALFRRFLEAGFLIPPDPQLPLILPAVLSPGEEAKLAGLLQRTFTT